MNKIFILVLTQIRKFNWKAKTLGGILLVLLVVVLNPEVRAFLLVIDFLGADVFLLLLGGYVSQYWPILVSHLRPVFKCLARRVGTALKFLRFFAYGLVPRELHWAQIDHIGIAWSVAIRVATGRLKFGVTGACQHQT